MPTVATVLSCEVPNQRLVSNSGVYTRRYSVSNLFQDGIKNVISPGATGPGLPRDPLGVSYAGRQGPESAPYCAKGEYESLHGNLPSYHI